jgi:hypothetical protein
MQMFGKSLPRNSGMRTAHRYSADRPPRVTVRAHCMLFTHTTSMKALSSMPWSYKHSARSSVSLTLRLFYSIPGKGRRYLLDRCWVGPRPHLNRSENPCRVSNSLVQPAAVTTDHWAQLDDVHILTLPSHFLLGLPYDHFPLPNKICQVHRTTKFNIPEPQRRGHVRDRVWTGEKTLKSTSEKVWAGFNWLRTGSSGGCCEFSVP